MDLNLPGKRALVCGSTQGMGKAIAEELARCGANVTLFAREEKKLSEVVATWKEIHMITSWLILISLSKSKSPLVWV